LLCFTVKDITGIMKILVLFVTMRQVVKNGKYIELSKTEDPSTLLKLNGL
jgi:hypothetical protein